MQTFVPCDTFSGCARVLDRQRLGKQRVEVLQMLKALRSGGGWSNHPAVKMWAGRENALVTYGRVVCDAWRARGYKDTCDAKIAAYYDQAAPLAMPEWWGGPIHATHRAALLFKDRAHYDQFGWIEKPDVAYYWPSHLGDVA